MRIIVGSASNRKIKVVLKVLEHYFEDEISIQGHGAPSGVPETPYGKQTFDGAKNRALYCKANHVGDCYVGLESGLVVRYGEMYEESWTCILTDDKEYLGYSSGLKLPKYLLKKMEKLGMEHGDVMALIEKELGDVPNDTWGTYSGGLVIREVSLEESIRNAVVQIVTAENSLYHL